MGNTSSVADFLPAPTMESVSPNAKAVDLPWKWAYRLLWLTLFTFFASTGAGKLWDRVWHLTHKFDTFWSPPHFFVFLMTVITGLIVAFIAFTPRFNACFGPMIYVPFMRMKIAGPLVILGGGLVALTITVLLDNFWHTAFGLDETQWSVPHDMLGWSWFTIVIGFVAARMAFRHYRPINWFTRLLIGLIVIEFMCPAILGPFYLHYSPNLVNALRTVPIVLTEPSAQHMYHIYLHFGLTRQTSPLFIPIVAFFAGCAMMFLHKLDKRASIFLLAPFIWSITLMARDLYTIEFIHYAGATNITDVLHAALKEPSLWVPIPIFAAVLAYTALARTSFSDLRIYAISGVIFGICTFLIWHTSLWMLLLAIPAGITMPLGSRIGKWLYDMIEKPTFSDLMKFLLTTCAQIPAVLGIVDLILRWNTPYP